MMLKANVNCLNHFVYFYSCQEWGQSASQTKQLGPIGCPGQFGGMHDIHSFRVRRLKAIHIVSALIFFEKYVPQNMPNGCNDGPFLPDMKCRPHSCTTLHFKSSPSYDDYSFDSGKVVVTKLQLQCCFVKVVIVSTEGECKWDETLLWVSLFQICVPAPLNQTGVLHRAFMDCGNKRLHAEIRRCDIKNICSAATTYRAAIQKEGKDFDFVKLHMPSCCLK